MRSLARTVPGRRGIGLGPVVRIVAAAFLALLGLGLLLGPSAEAQPSPEAGPYALVVELDRPIDNVTSRFLSRALDSGEARGAELVIIRLDTPGGLVTAMRDMVGDIFASPVPVAVFVAPEGAHAASAGTFITAAAGIAAMAPATNIGAAAVVGGGGEDLPETISEKATQDAVSLLRSIADRRDRNADALAETVLDAKAFSASEALEADIVDLIAHDVPDLLSQLDGTTAPVGDGETTLNTSDLELRFIELGFFERILSFLSDPTIAFLLVSLGGLAIVVELLNFGTIIPGVLGVVMLILGFAGVGQLPFSWGGVALIILAMVFFFVEAQAPGFGVFGSLGAVTLVLGGLFLVGFFGTPEVPGSPSVSVNRWVLIGTGIAAGVAVVWLAREFRRARRGPGYVSPVAREALIGQVAQVTRGLDPEGEVRIAGEIWAARLPEGEQADEGVSVQIADVHGYRLDVEALADVAELPKIGDATIPASPADEPADKINRQT